MRHLTLAALAAGCRGVKTSAGAAIFAATTAASSRYGAPSILWGLGGFNSYAFNLMQTSFGDRNELATALVRYTSLNQPRPLSLPHAISLAESLVSGEMITQCPGERARTRYSVVLLTSLPDQASQCRTGDPCAPAASCAACKAAAGVQALRNLQVQYDAGEVTVQPIYLQLDATPNAEVQAEVAAMAGAGGSKPMTTSISLLKQTLLGLTLSGLSEPLKLKTVVAFNRSAIARAGSVLPDSDDDELKDGVEVRSGMDPLTPDVINGCDPSKDADLDGLTECEERLVGSLDCMGDPDGDALPDLPGGNS